MLPDHLSASQIIKFLMCPLTYRFQYIDQIETGIKSSSFALIFAHKFLGPFLELRSSD